MKPRNLPPEEKGSFDDATYEQLAEILALIDDVSDDSDMLDFAMAWVNGFGLYRGGSPTGVDWLIKGLKKEILIRSLTFNDFE